MILKIVENKPIISKFIDGIVLTSLNGDYVEIDLDYTGIVFTVIKTGQRYRIDNQGDVKPLPE